MAWSKYIFACDVHGDRQDARANAVMFQFLEDHWKPKLRIMGGDLWDFRPLRRGASDEDRREGMAVDFRAGVKWLVRFKPTHFLRGNHDERLWELAALDRGIESDYAKSGVGEIENLIGQMNCHMLPYDKRKGILRIGHLALLHGFNTGVSGARKTAGYYGCCRFGHIHTIEEIPVADSRSRSVARSVGCLCDLDMDYLARKPESLKHAHGFDYGVINEKTGEFHSWQASSVNGRWMFASEFVTL